LAIHYAKEGAHLVLSYLSEHEDANATKRLVEKEGRKCLLIPGDIGEEEHCKKIVQTTIDSFGRIDILVNNAGEQHVCEALEDISTDQLLRTFKTNIFSMFWLTKAALPHMRSGSSIINDASINAFKGNKHLIDYSATKGAIMGFTRSMALNLVERGIRVNAVAPGPIWTPLIPSTFPADKVKEFGANTPIGRPGQPDEGTLVIVITAIPMLISPTYAVAPSFVFLATERDSSYITGQTIHVNGGMYTSS